jgi:hypothetical protein
MRFELCFDLHYEILSLNGDLSKAARTIERIALPETRPVAVALNCGMESSPAGREPNWLPPSL